LRRMSVSIESDTLPKAQVGLSTQSATQTAESPKPYKFEWGVACAATPFICEHFAMYVPHRVRSGDVVIIEERLKRKQSLPDARLR
jgi:hypothetical protein